MTKEKHRVIGPRSRARVVATGLAAVLVMSSCGSDSDSAESSQESEATDPVRSSDSSSASSGGVSTEAPDSPDDWVELLEDCPDDLRGGTLTFGDFTPLRSFDIAATGTLQGSAGGNALLAIYDSLVRYNPETGEVESRMAESVEPNEDRTEWTIRLRPGIEFANGDPLTAEAVAYSLNLHRDAEKPTSLTAEAAPMSDVVVVDDLTVQVTMSAPWGEFANYMSTAMGLVVNPAVREAQGAEAIGAAPELGAGAGPFVLDHSTPGEEIVLNANPDYWGGAPCLEHIKFVRINGDRPTYEAFQQGELQVAMVKDPALSLEIDTAEVNALSTWQFGGTGLFVLNSKPGAATADPRVRQAFASALDVDVLDQRVSGGAGVQNTAIVSERSMLYPPDGLEGPANDPELARTLVEEAKADGWNGSLRLVCSDRPSDVEASLVLEALLSAVGIDLQIDRRDQTAFITATVSGDYDASCWSFTNVDALPSSAISRITGEGNVAGYSNPEMDAAVARLRSAATTEERHAVLVEIQAIWNETLPGAIWRDVRDQTLYADNVHGLAQSSYAYTYMDNAYIDA